MNNCIQDIAEDLRRCGMHDVTAKSIAGLASPKTLWALEMGPGVTLYFHHDRWDHLIYKGLDPAPNPVREMS